MKLTSFNSLHHELGRAAFEKAMAAQQGGRIDDAVAAYRRAIRQNPGMVAAHFNLGRLLRDRHDYPEAAVCFEGAARLRPLAGDTWLHLGEVLERVERYAEAVAAYRRAAACDPNDPRPGLHLGQIFLTLGDYRPAQEAFRSVVDGHPTNPEGHAGLAIALLLAGNFGAGWEQYEHRWQKLGIDPARRFGFPLWRGESIVGKRILVWREQGLGQELLFSTCLRDLVAAGAVVTYAAAPQLVPLLRRSLPGITVIEDGQWGGMEFECHLPVGSLPSKFRNTRIDFPNEGKYLVPDPALTAHWGPRLDQLGSGLKVGIAWRSGIRPDRRSSIDSSLEDWGSVFRIPGVRWINLQLDDCAAELDQAKALFGVTVHRWPKERLDRDLESLVALIATLDAVIIPSTAISALTGAVGTRSWEIDAGNVWWSHGEERCPWFPTIRFARKRSGQQDWSATLDAVAEELTAHALEGARA